MPDATDKLMAMQRGGFEAGWAAAVRKLCAEFDWASAAKIKPAAAVEFLGKVLAGMHLRTEGNGERGTGNGDGQRQLSSMTDIDNPCSLSPVPRSLPLVRTGQGDTQRDWPEVVATPDGIEWREDYDG